MVALRVHVLWGKKRFILRILLAGWVAHVLASLAIVAYLYHLYICAYFTALFPLSPTDIALNSDIPILSVR